MAHSHVCLACGRDLARLRAAPEPAYGWWIVRCPDCGRVAVRRRHPLGRLLRSAIRLDAALTGLVTRAITGVVVGLGAAALATRIADRIVAERKLLEVPDAELVLAALVPLALGVWITVALAHWRPLRAWLATWAALTIVLVARRAEGGVLPAALPEWGRWIGRFAASAAEEVTVLAPAAGVVIAAALLGVPLGLGLRWSGRAARRARFRWYRRAARQGRFVPG